MTEFALFAFDKLKKTFTLPAYHPIHIHHRATSRPLHQPRARQFPPHRERYRVPLPVEKYHQPNAGSDSLTSQMNRLFTKSEKKPKKSSSLRDSDEEPAAASSPSSPHSPKPRSPLKKSVSARSSRTDDDHPQKSRSEQGSSHKSRSSNFSSSKSGHGARRKADLDLDTHPLNLSEAERKRLSALSMMSDPMDVDSEGPVSPPPAASIPGAFDAPAPAPAPAPTSAPAAAPAPKSNGAPVNGEGPPLPPPHKSNPTSPAAPAAPTPEEAEAFKAAGNKFYKEKNYKKAIEEYTKGAFELMGDELWFVGYLLIKALI